MDKGAIEEIKKGQTPDFRSILLDSKTGAPLVALPPGWTTASVKKLLDEYLPKPERVKGTLGAEALGSFIAATNRYKNANSAVFYVGDADQKSVKALFLSVLNYHPEGGDDTKAEWADHRVQYVPQISSELQTWLENNGEQMSQADFAAFIEDNAADLAFVSDVKTLPVRLENISPVFATPGDMVMMSRGIEIRATENFVSAYRADNGTMNMQFTQQHEGADGGPVKVPQWFALQVRIFKEGDIYNVPVRLRYRAASGRVAWFYEMYRMQDIFDKALMDAVLKVKEQTELPIFNGKPE